MKSGHHYFLLFPQCFEKAIKSWNCGKEFIAILSTNELLLSGKEWILYQTNKFLGLSIYSKHLKTTNSKVAQMIKLAFNLGKIILGKEENSVYHTMIFSKAVYLRTVRAADCGVKG